MFAWNLAYITNVLCSSSDEVKLFRERSVTSSGVLGASNFGFIQLKYINVFMNETQQSRPSEQNVCVWLARWYYVNIAALWNCDMNRACVGGFKVWQGNTEEARRREDEYDYKLFEKTPVKWKNSFNNVYCRNHFS